MWLVLYPCSYVLVQDYVEIIKSDSMPLGPWLSGYGYMNYTSLRLRRCICIYIIYFVAICVLCISTVANTGLLKNYKLLSSLISFSGK